MNRADNRRTDAIALIPVVHLILFFVVDKGVVTLLQGSSATCEMSISQLRTDARYSSVPTAR